MKALAARPAGRAAEIETRDLAQEVAQDIAQDDVHGVTQDVQPAQERACLCARIADENKARDILVLDMRGVTPLFDFMVLATGGSRRQVHNIVEEVDDAMNAEGDRRRGIEGYEASKWVVQDYGDVIVHVFDPLSREYYGLEHLWADAPKIDWRRC